MMVPDVYRRPSSLGTNLTMSSGRIYPSRTIQIVWLVYWIRVHDNEPEPYFVCEFLALEIRTSNQLVD